MTNRVVFLIDGFNLYHSILRLKKDLNLNAKWLNLHSLCKSYVPLFGKEATLEKIFYFTAIPTHLSDRYPQKVPKHKNYIKILESLGVHAVLGRFKEKIVHCSRCNSDLIKHEEKETDVSIALKVIEVSLKDICETVVIVTGDTDLAPAIRTAKDLFPSKEFVFAFPFARKNKELEQLAPKSFSINKNQYLKHQLPNPFVLPDGTNIIKPGNW